jgi:hypothetical protein
MSHVCARRNLNMNWADLNEKQKQQIEKEYRNGNEPGDIAAKFGLKSKQVSDQAYRKKWEKPAESSSRPQAAVKKTAKKAVKKAVKKVAKKVVKKAVKKTAKKAVKKTAKKAVKKTAK